MCCSSSLLGRMCSCGVTFSTQQQVCHLTARGRAVQKRFLLLSKLIYAKTFFVNCFASFSHCQRLVLEYKSQPEMHFHKFIVNRGKQGSPRHWRRIRSHRDRRLLGVLLSRLWRAVEQQLQQRLFPGHLEDRNRARAAGLAP